MNNLHGSHEYQKVIILFGKTIFANLYNFFHVLPIGLWRKILLGKIFGMTVTYKIGVPMELKHPFCILLLLLLWFSHNDRVNRGVWKLEKETFCRFEYIICPYIYI